eukprot:s8_g48.t1
MKILGQKVARATVEVDGLVQGRIGTGLVLMLGIREGTSDEEIETAASKVMKLKLWPETPPGAGEEMPKPPKLANVVDKGYEVLVLLQQSLCASFPGHVASLKEVMEPAEAQLLFEEFVKRLQQQYQEEMVVAAPQRGHVRIESTSDGEIFDLSALALSATRRTGQTEKVTKPPALNADVASITRALKLLKTMERSKRDLASAQLYKLIGVSKFQELLAEANEVEADGFAEALEEASLFFSKEQQEQITDWTGMMITAPPEQVKTEPKELKELTWEGDCAFTMTGPNESGTPKALALQGLRSLRPNASEEWDSLGYLTEGPAQGPEEIDEAFQSAVVEAWRNVSARRRNPRLSELTASYEELRGIARGFGCMASYKVEAPTGRGKKKPRSRLQKLHGLLQSLPWQQRRQTLLALSETQRRALEGWILSKHRVRQRERCVPTSQGRLEAVTAAPRAAQIWRCGAGFVAAVHLGRGLHAQVSRGWVQAQPEAQLGNPKLFLRVRMNISGQRLSTPLRADVSMVLLEWLQLGCHQGETLHPGRSAPEMAASRWLQTCNAWREIWKKRGRAPDPWQLQQQKCGDFMSVAFYDNHVEDKEELEEIEEEVLEAEVTSEQLARQLEELREEARDPEGFAAKKAAASKAAALKPAAPRRPSAQKKPPAPKPSMAVVQGWQRPAEPKKPPEPKTPPPGYVARQAINKQVKE